VLERDSAAQQCKNNSSQSSKVSSSSSCASNRGRLHIYAYSDTVLPVASVEVEAISWRRDGDGMHLHTYHRVKRGKHT
jgi:hypothetical protein